MGVRSDNELRVEGDDGPPAAAAGAGLLIGYARVSTEQQDVAVQRHALEAISVDRIYVDEGLTGTNRERPGLREALAACRSGDTLVVTKLDRLARSLPDARDIVQELTERGVKLSLGGSIHDPNDPVGRLLFNVLAMIAEFESDLIRMRTREGMKLAKAKGRLRGTKPKLSRVQQAHLMELYVSGEHSVTELAQIFGVSRQTVYRVVERAELAAASSSVPIDPSGEESGDGAAVGRSQAPATEPE